MKSTPSKTPVISIHELRKSFGEIERSLPFVDHVTITKNGKPIATLNPIKKRKVKHPLRTFAGAWKKTEFDDSSLWKEVLKRKSRAKSIKL
ncbi:MAG TPA: hypothetical protein PLD54_03820 [Candidatus Levybacteria bacterium]|nr:hypothetical protein [Candidatus Levybacteria bacterium]